jgi:hypothetical protein
VAVGDFTALRDETGTAGSVILTESLVLGIREGVGGGWWLSGWQGFVGAVLEAGGGGKGEWGVQSNTS